jgi:hypothetical protein
MASSVGVVRCQSATRRSSAVYSQSLIRVNKRHLVLTSTRPDLHGHRHDPSTKRTVASAGLTKEARQFARPIISIEETTSVPIDKSPRLWYTDSRGP